MKSPSLLSLSVQAEVSLDALPENPSSILTPNLALDALKLLTLYINVKSNFLSRSIAEIGFKLFASVKDHLLSGEMGKEDYEAMILASTLLRYCTVNLWAGSAVKKCGHLLDVCII